MQNLIAGPVVWLQISYVSFLKLRNRIFYVLLLTFLPMINIRTSYMTNPLQSILSGLELSFPLQREAHLLRRLAVAVVVVIATITAVAVVVVITTITAVAVIVSVVIETLVSVKTAVAAEVAAATAY